MKATHDGSLREIHCRTVWLFAGCMLLPLQGGCGADSKHESERAVVAKVNGDEITVRELNDQFSRIALHTGLDGSVGKKQVLDALVDEKLLAQKASASGLDQRPEVIIALDRAKRQVLAQAAIESAMQDGRVNARDIKTFYEAHPGLFERRRTYVFRRFDVLAGELQPSIKAELDKAGSPTEVALILKRANLRFSDQTEIRAAEMLPTEFLTQAAEMQRGDILILRQARQIVLMQLVRSIAEPIDLVRATPTIRAYLGDGRRKDAAELLLRNLRKSAKIEYTEGVIDGFQIQADAASPANLQDAAIRKDVTKIVAASPSR